MISRERDVKMTVREEIEQLKREKNAVIPGPLLVPVPEVQEAADYTGDSFYLQQNQRRG